MYSRTHYLDMTSSTNHSGGALLTAVHDWSDLGFLVRHAAMLALADRRVSSVAGCSRESSCVPDEITPKRRRPS